MSQRLFAVGKVGVFVDAVAMGKEKRKGGEECTVLKLVCRVEPQAQVVFSEAEPSLLFEEDEDGDDEGDDAPFDARHVVGPRPIPDPPMFDEDEPPSESLADREKRSRPTAKRGTKAKTKKHDPEAEHAEQLAGKGRVAVWPVPTEPRT